MREAAKKIINFVGYTNHQSDRKKFGDDPSENYKSAPKFEIEKTFLVPFSNFRYLVCSVFI